MEGKCGVEILVQSVVVPVIVWNVFVCGGLQRGHREQRDYKKEIYTAK